MKLRLSKRALSGRSGAALRMGLVILAAFAVVVFVANIPSYIAELGSVCTRPGCNTDQLTEEDARVLRGLGLTVGDYAAYFGGLTVASASVWFGVAALIAWRKPDDLFALFVALTLVLVGAFSVTGSVDVGSSSWSLPTRLVNSLELVCFMFFLSLFPDGRFVPRWTLWVALGATALGASSAIIPESPLGPLWFVFAGSLLGAQIYRYRRVSGPVQRQQTKWVLFAVGMVVLTVLGMFLATQVFSASGRPGVFTSLLLAPAASVMLLLIPLSIGVAILRYRLFDIDFIINRTLVYAALTACVVGLYVLIVGYLGALFRTSGNLLFSLVATGLVAVLFQPLRERLQRGVNRLMYGERDEPYKVLSRLGRRLEASLAPEAVLPAIVEDVARALRLPHVAIWLSDGETLRLGSVHGVTPPETAARDAGAVEALRHAPDGLRPAELGSAGEYGSILEALGTTLVLPLTHRGELVGALSMAPRSPGETFSPADRQLLRDLATQAGATADAVRLTVALRSSVEDLRHSRERLVAAQEEERRRIQRDLHDGLGPVLASMGLRLEACLDIVKETEAPLSDDLERLYDLVGQATSDIRRLVYDLRPPVLDQLGLVPAIRQHCERFSRESGIEASFEADRYPSIPAAAEVTLLRVVQEALLNVHKHAHASLVNVRLGCRDGWIELEIRDDGVGFETNGQGGGTGIGSMRERAELLGGALHVAGRSGAGTEVTVRIPTEIPSEEVTQ